jgi:hypothetical protein
LLHCRCPGRLGDFFAFVEGLEDDDTALAVGECFPKRAQLVDGLGPRMEGLRPAPVPPIRKSPTSSARSVACERSIPDVIGSMPLTR